MNIKDAKILIVEDEPQINRLIELVLQSDGYYNISKSYDGADALEKITKENYDLVLLDVMIPSIDGYALCKIIKENKKFDNVQVIMLTAKKLEEDVIEGFECGAVDYITKPFSNKILLARVKAHLKNYSSLGEVLVYDDTTLDDSKQSVYAGDNEIELTNFEYKILKLFMQNVGRVFSRAYLLEYLRGEGGYNVSERAIDVQILNLRRKLKNLAKCIVTIRGTGYKLKEL